MADVPVSNLEADEELVRSAVDHGVGVVVIVASEAALDAVIDLVRCVVDAALVADATSVLDDDVLVVSTRRTPADESILTVCMTPTDGLEPAGDSDDA